MMRVTLIRIAVLFLPFLGCTKLYAQQSEKIDSLENVLKTSKDDTFKVKTIDNLCHRLFVTGDLNKAMSYAHIALALSEKLGFKGGLADIYNDIGVIYKDKADFYSALKNNQLALKVSTEMQDKRRMASSYLDIGTVYFEQGDYPEAMKNDLASLRISEETGNKLNAANAYLNIGNIDFKQNNLDEALKNYFVALKIEKEVNSKNSMAYVYGSIGNVYFQQVNFDEALKYYSITLDLSKEAGNKQSISNCYNNIGNIYFQEKDYAEALKNHLESLKTKEEIGDLNGMIPSYQNLGELYLVLGKMKEAEVCMQKALTLARQIGSREGIADSYYHLSELDSAKGDPANAYKNFKLYEASEDSILSEKSGKEIARLRIQYDAEKKDREINTQSLKLQNQRLHQNVLMTRVFYGIAISFLVIGVVVLLFYLRARRRRKEYESSLVTLELTALKSQLNPHFIFNALNSIKAYIESNPKTGSDYLTRFSILMRGVLESSEEKEISLADEMQLMLHYIELERLRLRHGITYSITYDESVNKEEVMIPPLITQPVIENAVWHGLGSMDREGTLRIHHYIANSTLFITITNSAQNNLPHYVNSARRKSFGMKIMRERLALLKQTNGTEGTINFDMLPDETKVTVTIPLKNI